jgi:hypothetical protein
MAGEHPENQAPEQAHNADGRRPAWRQSGHDLGLLFCGALVVFLVSTLAVRLVGVHLVRAVRGWESAAARVALGVLALDFTRAPALLLVAWVLGGLVQLRPLSASVGLVLLTYLFDILVVAVLGQLGPLYGSVAVVLCRAAAAALLVWLGFLVFRRRRG